MKIKMFWYVIKSSVGNTLLFRGSFLLKILTILLSEIFSVISMLIILTRFQGYGDMTSGQFLFLYFFSHLSYSLCILVFNNLRALGFYIQGGFFDKMLLMPVNTMAYLCCYNFDFSIIGQVITSLILFSYFDRSYGIVWNFGSVLFIIMMLISSILILASILIVLSSVAYYIIDWKPLDNMFGAFREMLGYPMSIYTVAVRIILYSLVPIAYIAFVPVELIYLFSKDLTFGMGMMIAFGVMLCAGLLFYGAYKLWFYQSKKYQSVG